MAKKSAIAKNKQRQSLAESRAEVRTALRDLCKKGDFDAVVKLNKRPRNESKVRLRNRCQQCGRPRGTYKRFGLCRICLRKAAMGGNVPGLVKASW
ncbi:MAG: 30S ribosomal protein S14 [Gammaproteobacteria bacterium RIFCSPHIGHO2_12_FULL_41_15]|nr:MAG: 30S ribosomal protein S14 [Gammaproteobacteria bacterium RIFCSPHIGHO2_12_FULL_41_15]